jgi:hypothetical protein
MLLLLSFLLLLLLNVDPAIFIFNLLGTFLCVHPKITGKKKC